ncbi:MAG TPA: PEP/pyruvate-binding domain-containing protein [Desulfosporosinus sp.]|nr:PEP/pyruvate-binding domain-containing protein [Desulfosporosinus sp.]
MTEMKHEKYFLDWEETFSAGASIAGGKGWNLGRLAHYGFEVPLGGTVITEVYYSFIQENGLEDKLREVANYASQNERNEATLILKLDQLRENIRKGKLSEMIVQEIFTGLKKLDLVGLSLAVRSSASSEDSQGASFAGMHDSYLNVHGLEQVLTAVKNCYASLWTLRALLYRQKMGFKDSEVIPSVVILEMVKAEASGIGFSCNPQSGRLDQLVINANYGLGESVVGGAVEPDQYILDCSYFLPKIVAKVIGLKQLVTVTKEDGGTELQKPELLGLNSENQVLTDKDIAKLGLLVLRVSEALGEGEKPQDIEWVFDGDHFWLVQARPVTVLPIYTYPALKGQAEIWSNANFKDAVPMVITAFNRKIVIEGINGLLTAILKETGYVSPDGLQYSKFYKGRVYLNPSLLQWEFFDTMGMHPRETNAQLGGHQPEIKLPEVKDKKGFKNGLNKTRMLLAIMKVQKNSNYIFLEIRKYCNDCATQELSELTDTGIASILMNKQELVAPFYKLGILNSVAGIMLDTLVKALKKDFPTNATSVAITSLIGQGKITSAEQGYDLIKLAEIARTDSNALQFFLKEPFLPLSWETSIIEGSDFKQQFRMFIKDYGHRAVYELDLSNPRWKDDPSYLLNYIRDIMGTADLKKIKTKQRLQAEKIREQITSTVPIYRRWKINWLISQAVKGEESRERGKSELARLAGPLRMLTSDIGRRLDERGILEDSEDIFYCSPPDILSILLGHWNGQGLKALVTDRKERHMELQKLDPPDLIMNDQASFVETASINLGGEIMGLGVAGGRAEGQARLLYHPNDGLEQGEVLVAPSTDPGWTPLFLKASGIIMETGGFLSHGAIVAREYGIPAVVNIPGVMKIIKKGDRVVVDGDMGKVYLDKIISD